MKKACLVKQRDLTDCGAACLASVAAHYGLHLPVAPIRQAAGTDRQGTNLLGMIEAAATIGLDAKGFKGPPECLPQLPLPAIAHVIINNRHQHYVVIHRVTKRQVEVMDPAIGKPVRYRYDEFGEIWSGIVLLLVPGEQFVPGLRKHPVSQRFWQLTRPHMSVMLQALAGAFLVTILGLATSIYVQKLVDFVIADANTRLLHILSAAMVLLLMFQGLLGYYKDMFMLKTGQQIDSRLIMGYYRHLMTLPQQFFDTMRVGDVLSRVNDAVKIRLFINDIATGILINCFLLLCSFALMFLYYWKLALLMVMFIPIAYLLYWISNRINRKWQRKIMEQGAEMETVLVESLQSATAIRQLNLEEHFVEKTESAFTRLLRSIFFSGWRTLQLSTSADLVTRLFTILVLWLGSYFVIHRELSMGELLSFYAIIAYFTGPSLSLISANKSIQDALIAAERLFEVLDLHAPNVQTTANLIDASPGDITFNEVYFSYGNRRRLFEGLQFTIRRGTCTAFVGESGSGKSTILNLVQGLYIAAKGNIEIAGIDIRHLDKNSLRSLVTVVPQKVELFSGTVLENITIGDAIPDLRRVLEVCEQLDLGSFISELPHGLHTYLEEQGANLSGGQRQKISIARALYRNPEVLILDEPTASMDIYSEQKIQAALLKLRDEGKTVIIVAHRLSTITGADCIFVLQEGKMVQEGTHETLLSTDGPYRELWNQHYPGVWNT